MNGARRHAAPVMIRSRIAGQGSDADIHAAGTVSDRGVPMAEACRYRTRLAATAAETERAQRLRHAVFRPERGEGLDRDGYDPRCRHLLVEDAGSGRLMATVRAMPLGSGSEIGQSYSAQFYDLGGLRDFGGPLLEVGRFCVAPGCRDPEVLRVTFAALASLADREGTELLFGCTSFRGTDASAHADAFAWLKGRHLAPKRWRPRIKSPNVFRFAERLRRGPDPVRALKAMPPLLRGYLALGGWVSDHAVIDRELNTLHVFTGLEVARIPERRIRSLMDAALVHSLTPQQSEA